jgi:hypothetical protein
MMQIIGCCVRTKRFIKNIYNSDYEYSSSLEILGNKDIGWIANVPKDTIFIEKITFIKNDDFLHKYKIWYEEQLYMKLTLSQKKFLVKQKINCPWIWIGENDNDMTQVLEEFLLDGNKIKLELLNKLFPDIKKWSYVCSKTLEIKEFPVEGIQIKHDTE